MIVVIAILAAISIVAYNGIQNRGKSSSAQSLANQIVKKSEAWNTVQSSYPTFAQLKTNKTDAAGDGSNATVGNANYQGSIDGPAEARLDDSTKIVRATSPSNESNVLYRRCNTSSAQIQYYDAQASTTVIIGLGGASTTTLCTAG